MPTSTGKGKAKGSTTTKDAGKEKTARPATKARATKPEKAPRSTPPPRPTRAAKPAAASPDVAATPIDDGRIAELELALMAAKRAQSVAEGALAAAASRADEEAERADALAARLSTSPSLAAPAAPGTLVCPRCGERMVEIQHLGVTIDRCNGCGGLYFDAGELEEVIEREYPEEAALEMELELVTESAAPPDTPDTEAVPEEIAAEITAKGYQAEGSASGKAPPAAPQRGFLTSLFSRKPKPPAAP